MTIKETWVVWDCQESGLLSIHPFKELAERYRNKLHDKDDKSYYNKYMVVSLESALMWMAQDAFNKGKDAAFKLIQD